VWGGGTDEGTLDLDLLVLRLKSYLPKRHRARINFRYGSLTTAEGLRQLVSRSSHWASAASCRPRAE
jgi:hypothetical protein